jgi:hypothetical protein
MRIWTMKRPTMKNLYRALVITTYGIMMAAFSPVNSASNDDFEKQVEDYIQKFPYQDTFDYAMRLSGGDSEKLNQWGQASRDLLKAGEDKIVRVNNDTLYKTAFVYLGEGPVVLRSDSPSKERFSSFQLQDDRNANYRNIIGPAGSYTLYHGEKPETITGEAVEVPSLLSAVVTRIEVKDPRDAHSRSPEWFRRAGGAGSPQAHGRDGEVRALQQDDRRARPGTRQGCPLSLPLRRHQGGLGWTGNLSQRLRVNVYRRVR